MEIINTFTKGIDKDASKTLLEPSKSRHLENWRLITEKGASTGSLENIKGNRLFFTFPTTSPVSSFRVNISGSGVHGSNDTIEIIINGVIYTLFAGLTGETSDTTVYRNILVTRLNAATSLDQNGNTITNPLRAFNIVAVPQGTDAILLYSTGTSVTTLSTTTSGHIISGSISTIVAPQSNLEIIGWATIREDFIILTCSKNNPATGGPGQIWRLTYVPESIGNIYTSTLTLLYNNNVNFTVEHPIPSPGGIIGRYENALIQRIYFTDFFNQYRVFNTADINGFGFPVTLLNILPSTNFSIPIFVNVTVGGALPNGIYQYSYLLSKGGQETLFAPLSNMIPVNAALETTIDVRTYIGGASGTATLKQNNLIIKGLDTKFDTIRIISVYRKNDIDVPEIKLIIEEPVPDDGVFTFSHTGNEVGAIILTLEEFSLLSSSFTHCRTIQQKDNVVFAGNVRNRRLNLDYDARAFRFSSVQQGPNTTNGYPVGTLPDVLNDVNTDQRTFRFQSNGGTVGGTGFLNPNNSNLPNVSYEIRGSGYPLPPTPATRLHLQDSKRFTINTPGVATVPHRIPDPGSKNAWNIGVANQDYDLQYFFENYSHPGYHGLFKGYARTETYRVGIEFYALDGTPDFVKWIGDIRMPQSSDGFPITTYDAVNSNCYTHPLFLRFTVNIPSSIRSQIGGFSIVRVKRTQSDKTVLSQGTLGTVDLVNGVYTIPPAILDGLACEARLIFYVNPGSGPHYVRGFFPDFFFNNGLDFRQGDRLEVLERLDASQLAQYAPVGGNVNINDIRTGKYYSTMQPNLIDFSSADVLYGTVVEQGAIAQNINNGTFTNQYIDTDTIRGQKCFLMQIGNLVSDAGAFNPFSNLLPTSGIYLVNYIRPNSNQYGGSTLTARASNKYISCGHFQPIDQTSSNALSFTFDVYGGDTFVPIWDFQERLKNNNVNPGTVHIPFSQVNYFMPVETTLDIDMRAGQTVNRNNITIYGGDLDESQDLPRHYNIENDIRQYIPKPINFSLSEEFDNRIHASQIKINGEETDQWTKYLPADYIDVEGSYGPVNSLVRFKEFILYFQDKAFGMLNINPRVILQDQAGIELQLGTGAILENFKYISTEAGSKSKWGIVIGIDSLLFFDVYNKKIYNYSGGSAVPLSDIKGIQSFLHANIKGDILSKDNPIIGKGVTTTYDYRFMEAIFTFHDVVERVVGTYQSLDSYYSLITSLPEGIVKQLTVGQTIQISSLYNNQIILNPIIIVSIEDSDTIKIGAGLPLLQNGDTITIVGSFKNSFTIAYNSYGQAFTSFYSFVPSIYLNDKRIILTPNPDNKKSVYIHNEDKYCSFYGKIYPSLIQLLVNPVSAITKVFDNFLWHTEVEDGSGTNILSESANKLRVRTDYQDSSVQILDLTKLKRKERSWNVPVPRNKNKDRMRDKYMLVDLEFNNLLNRRVIFHFLKTLYRASAR